MRPPGWCNHRPPERRPLPGLLPKVAAAPPSRWRRARRSHPASSGPPLVAGQLPYRDLRSSSLYRVEPREGEVKRICPIVVSVPLEIRWKGIETRQHLRPFFEELGEGLRQGRRAP